MYVQPLSFLFRRIIYQLDLVGPYYERAVCIPNAEFLFCLDMLLRFDVDRCDGLEMLWDSEGSH